MGNYDGYGDTVDSKLKYDATFTAGFYPPPPPHPMAPPKSYVTLLKENGSVNKGPFTFMEIWGGTQSWGGKLSSTSVIYPASTLIPTGDESAKRTTPAACACKGPASWSTLAARTAAAQTTTGPARAASRSLPTRTTSSSTTSRGSP